MVQHTYRPDIDGLRAIAVLTVIGFHAFPNYVRAGFIGVDIFFVISGFLISRIIYQGLQAGTFSFVDFYARRVRRIFPALIVVLLACLVAGWAVMLPGELRLLGKHTGAGAGFVANFSLWKDVGYFAPAADQVPLLHLWSLGIEEQFYLIWPLLVFLVWRRGSAALVLAAAIGLVSFICNIMLVRSDPVSAFYLPVSRFWELMLGCGLAFASARMTEPTSRPFGLPPDALDNVAGWLGAALIVAALVLLDQHKSFPGWWALLPTLGTALLIWAGPASLINRIILSHRAVVYIGLISYPLYLWHWPILAFGRIVHVREPTVLMKLAAIAAAFILADLTYRLIEKPIRFGIRRSAKTVTPSLALASVGCVGLLLFVRDGFPGRFPADAQTVIRDQTAESMASYRMGSCFFVNERFEAFPPECDGVGPATSRRVVLWGDSHAAHLFPGLRTLERKHGDFILSQYTASGCPPVFSFSPAARKDCAATNDFVARKIAEFKPHTVVMAGRWELYDGRNNWGQLSEPAIRAAVMQLERMGVKRIVVIGPFPSWQTTVPRIRTRFLRTSLDAAPKRDVSYLSPAPKRWDETMRRATTGLPVIYVSPLSAFCDKTGCLLAVPSEGSSVAWDSSHLTPAGSDFFAQSNAFAILGR